MENCEKQQQHNRARTVWSKMKMWSGRKGWENVNSINTISELTTEETAPTFKMVLYFIKKGLRLQRKTQIPQRRNCTDDNLQYTHTWGKNNKMFKSYPPTWLKSKKHHCKQKDSFSENMWIRASMIVQWLRICLATRGTLVRSWPREDSACVHHSCWSRRA